MDWCFEKHELNKSVLQMYSTVSCNISITCSLAHTTAREEMGCLEQLQVMPLALTLTHTADWGLQGWSPVFSRALLSSSVYNSLPCIFFSRLEAKLLLFTRNHFSVWEAFLPKRFQTQEPFPLCSPSAFAWITVEQLGSSFSLLKQLLKRVLLHPSVNVAIQAHAIATCNHFESRISLWFQWGLLLQNTWCGVVFGIYTLPTSGRRKKNQEN